MCTVSNMKFNNIMYVFWIICIFFNFKNISAGGGYNQSPSGYATDIVYKLHNNGLATWNDGD